MIHRLSLNRQAPLKFKGQDLRGQGMVAQDFRMEMELLRADSKGSRAVNTSWASWRGYIEGQLVRVQEQAEKDNWCRGKNV